MDPLLAFFWERLESILNFSPRDRNELTLLSQVQNEHHQKRKKHQKHKYKDNEYRKNIRIKLTINHVQKRMNNLCFYRFFHVFFAYFDDNEFENFIGYRADKFVFDHLVKLKIFLTCLEPRVLLH